MTRIPKLALASNNVKTSSAPAKWPATAIETRRADDLVVSKTNARMHSKAQIAQISRSIVEFGWTMPILIDESNRVLAGHGRLLAAQELKIQNVPVIVARGWSDAQKQAYETADNAIPLSATWNVDLLGESLKTLKGMNFDLTLLGFDAPDLQGIMSRGLQLQQDIDDVPEAPDTATTRKGDMWIIGEMQHRLLCGDSSNPDDVDRLVAGAGGIHLLNTDPPYNIKVEPRSNNAIAYGNSSYTNAPSNVRAGDGLSNHQHFDTARMGVRPRTTQKLRPKDRRLQSDFITAQEFDLLLRAWFNNASKHLLPGRGFYIWGGYSNVANYPSAIAEAGLYFSQAVIWVKGHPTLLRKDMMADHEWCFYGWKEGAAHKWYGPNNITDVWNVKKLNHTAMVHLTEKPVELGVRAMHYSSLEGENVLDLFGGSGSTMAAAEATKRRAFLVEIDELYADVIVMRMQKLTCRPAILDGDGRTFDELRAERTDGSVVGKVAEPKMKSRKTKKSLATDEV